MIRKYLYMMKNEISTFVRQEKNCDIQDTEKRTDERDTLPKSQTAHHVHTERNVMERQKIREQ